jgi:hypothetical protein
MRNSELKGLRRYCNNLFLFANTYLGDIMNKNEKKNLKDTKIDEYQIEMTPSAVSIGDAPDDSFQLINKYGTYEIQPTADTDNKFPTIAQGFSRKEQERERLDEKKGDK